MKILYWAVISFGSFYSFWYAYYLIKDKNKLGAFGLIILGFLISGLSLMIRLK